MTKLEGEGSAEIGNEQDPEKRPQWLRGAIVGAGVIGLTVVAASTIWPGGGPEASPDPSASPEGPRDLPWGEPIPWDEVGPGWTLLAYDAAMEETEWGEDWNLAGDELWLAAPDGSLYFGADVSGLGATFIEAWIGTEVWLYQATAYEGEWSTGTLWTVDLKDGTAAIVGEDSLPRGSRQPTAVEGVYLTEGGCCGCSETTVHYADGTTRLLGDGCGQSSLSPDGLTLAYATESEVGGTYRTTFMVTDLDGNSTPVAESPLTDTYHELMWLDQGTLLVYGGNVDNWELTTLDVASGASTPWPGAQPESFYLQFWGDYPGSWLVWNDYSAGMATRITDRAGTPMIDLDCSYPSCWPTITGSLVVWEESDIEYAEGVRVGDDFQRLTLINPATGQRTPFIEFTRVDGHITTILPHPPVYG
ncbi:MAG: hypothetical protein JW722_06620 [Demequinaceae bacterium]|nr:hypothetical protein [Demequinaceae bacterium]